ncbi:F-box/kelch-repeat protein At3g23880 [Medicago truncatula]|uniref:F-box protein interaction domain protein n=1 Tax=Medicago truncatula TaxID=3880 RepID=A0A072UC12_MEDTR|nr:F-box/kelch-repeat protein At3g23880 [Medicago truncatula]KEH27172.1 F-box protein interaction domain protein [Medicago truncatula]
MEDIPPIKKQHLQSNTPLPPVFIPNELISLILCFLSVKTIMQFRPRLVTHIKYWFYVWNPATRTISDKFGFLRDYRDSTFVFSVGCDYLTGTYKVVALHIGKNKEKEIENKSLWRSKVKVFNSGDNCWRNIRSFPFVPILGNDGVHFSGTINWLAIHSDYAPIEVGGTFKTLIGPVEKCVIVSLDLLTETYTQFLLPTGFKELPYDKPSVRVLMDCLCFSHDFKGTEFVIWMMKEFGVQESWTQLFRIEYVNLQIHTMNGDTLLPLYFSKNGDTLIFTTEITNKVFIYNRRDKTVEITIFDNRIRWTSAIEYVESLVPTPWK